MSYDLKYDADQRMIELKIEGDISFADLRETATAAARLAKEKGCDLLLNDSREAKLRLMTGQIYEVTELLQETFSTNGVDVHTFKRALVAKDDLPDYKFFENLARNRGQPLRIFTDIEEARRWLIGPGAPRGPEKAPPE